MRRSLAAFFAALLCCLLALTLTAIALFGSEMLFAGALVANVEEDAGALRGFAGETIGYVSGRESAWQPTLETPSEAFSRHMASVRGAVTALPAVGAGLALAAAALLIVGRPFSARGWYIGASVLPICAVAVGAWALIDFDGLWRWLHVAFIPDGLFPASEPMMRLFPAALFQSYLLPAGAMLAAALLLIYGAPALRRKKGRVK